MGKYSNEFKLKVVKYCINKQRSYLETAQHFNIKGKTSVLKWVRKYKEHGVQGLIKNSQKYDGEFKLKVIEYMHKNHLSLTETAIKFNLGNHCIVDKWERIYYEEGARGLYKERRGSKNDMKFKILKDELSEKNNEDLFSEVYQLRMENEYLKKLNALVQKRIVQEQKKK